MPHVERRKEFRTYEKVPDELYYAERDWTPPALLVMMAQVGSIECGTFPGFHPYYRDQFDRAFDEYALQAFESEAVAYLLKPIRAEKLQAALAKAARLTRPQLQQIANATREPDRRTHIGVRGRDGLKLIPLEDVLCFQADQKYTTVRHAKGEDLIEDSLKTLEEEFSPGFLRVHRNALVNTRYLERIARDASGQHFVHLRGMAESLEVSRRMAGDLKDRFRI
jgi:two-component system response regulator AlgR